MLLCPMIVKVCPMIDYSRGESGHEVNTRHLAMGLLGLLLTRCPVTVRYING